ncbi:MAG TPA: M14 family zinc carboxypeptidase [Longimicrobium sp.]|nr:M14 family zinc carboxypeptidase [Longimicrobium sp.]
MTFDAERDLLHEAYALPALTRRKFTHAELWQILGTLVDEAGCLSREEIGRSAEDRPLYAVRFGHGPLRVLLFSQMHGDEPSHTMGLADLLCYFAREPDDERVRRLAEGLTVAAIPMLNPDGAERFIRTNAQGIDINRDARAWRSPEMQAFKRFHDELRPDFVLNLHDQDVRKRVGEGDRLTALALLATPGNPRMEDDERRIRAKRLGGAIRRAVEPLAEGRVARFQEEYNPTGSGEYTQRSGASCLLLECGYWPDDLEKQYLRKLSFVAILTALEALADGSYAEVPVEEYESLEENDTGVFDLLVRGGTVVVPGLEPFRADVGANFATPLDLSGGTTASVGDLADFTARVVVEAEGCFVHPEPEAMERDDAGRNSIEEGLPASYTVRRGAGAESEQVAVIRDGVLCEAEEREPADAI